MRVLVIEDERAVRDLVEDVLRFDGHEVLKAEDGFEGLALLENETVDVVLTDLRMPGLTGWDVATRVKQCRPFVKVGLLSSWGRHLAEAELAARGVDFMVLKPFAIRELWATFAALEASREHESA